MGKDRNKFDFSTSYNLSIALTASCHLDFAIDDLASLQWCLRAPDPYRTCKSMMDRIEIARKK